MSTSVLLRLDGPLQAWGTHSMFERRDTQPYPTLSGILGLVGAALGQPREEHPGPLAALDVAVRVDDPGVPMEDFQTVGFDGWISAAGNVTVGEPKLSRRWYLADAVFTAALSGPAALLEQVPHAVAHPRRPLHLGRRCCAPASPILAGVSALGPLDALAVWPYQGRRPSPPARMEVVYALRGAPDGWTVADVPRGGRRFAVRAMTRTTVTVPTVPAARAAGNVDDDPFGLNDEEQGFFGAEE